MRFFTAHLAILALITFPTGAARAQTTVDGIEHIFGSSNVNAAAGNGGMTIGISPLGDLSVLSWPSPSYTDQVMHIASNALDVRSQREMKGHPAMGSFIGLSYVGPVGSGFTWLRAGSWQISQGYGDPESALIQTIFTHPELGLSVVVEDYALPDRDVWVRHVDVTRDASNMVDSARLFFYANFAPTVSRAPQVPIADWAFDPVNDFAALYDPGSETLVHFRPAGRGDITELGHMLSPPPIDYGAVGTALAQPTFDASTATALMDNLDQDYGPGVYLAVGASQPIVDYQVGFDQTPVCSVIDDLVDNVHDLPTVFPGVQLPLDPSLLDVLRCTTSTNDIRTANGWLHNAADAFHDATDGVLSRSPGAAGRVNETLAVDLDLSTGRTEVAFYVAAAATATEARAGLAAAKATSATAHRAAVVADWSGWMGRARLPDTDDDRVLEVCRRALINLRVGTDRNTGAIVASISRQAPYGLDWPRDGAFFNAALDVAGFPEMVEAHNRFYLQTIRDQDAEAELFINRDPPPDPDDPTKRKFPADSWEMNYYADGMVGGNIRFEIDNTALLVWSMVYHAGYIEDDTQRRAWLEEVWPTVQRASNLLARWRDPETKLQAPANEDDNYDYTQTLHGAATVYGALTSAARAARTLGHEDDAVRYEDRAWELKQAILVHLYDPAAGLFVEGLDETANPGNAPAGSSSWMVWPARMLPYEDPKVVRQLRANLDLALTRLDPSAGDGGSYVTKVLIAAALALKDPADRERIEAGLRAMVNLAATPDTAILGETFVSVDLNRDGIGDSFSARVSNPHLWAATLVYLTAMALYHPELFDPHLPVLSNIKEPPLPGGCNCRTDTGGLPVGTALAIFALLWLRRRRRTCQTGGATGF